MESPDVVKRDNGFLPKGSDGSRPNQPPPDISLFNHASGSGTGLARYDSGYVSTTTSLTLAHYWVNNNLSGVGYIYHIQPTANMIDVNRSLGQYSPHPDEQEYASLGTIHWGQIIGWQEVSYGVLQSFQRNPDYQRQLYRYSHAAGSVPGLAGFPPDHLAWALHPWVEYTNCENTIVLEKNMCTPVDNADIAGQKYFYKENGKLLFISLIPSM